MIPYVASPREAAVAYLVWLVLGISTILVHEERIRVINESRQSRDIYTDRRKALWKSNIWLAVTIGLLVVFLRFSFMMNTTTGAYILGMEADARKIAWWTFGLLASIVIGCVTVLLVLYLRYRYKIKRPSEESEPKG